MFSQAKRSTKDIYFNPAVQVNKSNERLTRFSNPNNNLSRSKERSLSKSKSNSKQVNTSFNLQKTAVRTNTNTNIKHKQLQQPKQEIEKVKEREEDKSFINNKLLQFHIDDDYETLVNKNSILRQKLVEAQEKINQLNVKIKIINENNEKEKEQLDQELERIGKNYKIYAESHKKLYEKEKDFAKLNQEHEHNLTLIKLYQSHISRFLLDYIGLYSNVGSFNTSDLKKVIHNNLNKYRDIVDSFNFPDVFDEYQKLFNSEKTENQQQVSSNQSSQQQKLNSKPDMNNQSNKQILKGSYNQKKKELNDDKAKVKLNEEKIKNQHMVNNEDLNQPEQEYIIVRMTKDYQSDTQDFLSAKKNDLFTLKFIDQEKNLACVYNDTQLGLIPLQYLELVN